MKAVDVYAQFAAFREQGDLESAERLLLGWASESDRSETRWEALTLLNMLALEQGELDRVLIYCSELVAIDARDPYPHETLALAYRLCGELANAEHEARLAVDLARAVSGCIPLGELATLARILILEGRLDEAQTVLVTGWVEPEPDDSGRVIDLEIERLRLLGLLCMRGGQRARAVRYLRDALRLFSRLRPGCAHCYHAVLDELAQAIRMPDCE